MGKETAALLLILGVHLAVLPVLLWLLLDGERLGPPRRWPRDGRDEGDDDPRPVPWTPGGGELPLADAEPARVRLRGEHEKLADGRPHDRRPAREPVRPSKREPA